MDSSTSQSEGGSNETGEDALGCGRARQRAEERQHRNTAVPQEQRRAPETTHSELVVELCEQGHSSFSPVLLRVLRRYRQPDRHDVIGGMTSCGERAGPPGSLVDGAWVHISGLVLVVGIDGFEPHHGHIAEQHLGRRLANHLLVVIPLGPIHEQTIHIATRLRLLLQHILGLTSVQYGVVINELVDGHACGAGVVLQSAGEERLREEESRYPIIRWRALVNPLLHEVQTGEEVPHPRAERLQRRVCNLAP
mmetsp:Transcript_45985/g.114330  ORF Transcript_45985/g.114330 Transcript_45985/m.114330 type:complete len:251 (+) Transcript_45985:1345-2097(+)